MEPRIIVLERQIIAGFGFFGDPFAAGSGWTEENEIGQLWQRFMRFWEEQGSKTPELIPAFWYEIHTITDECREKGFFDVFVGVGATEMNGLIPGLLYKILPEGTYAVFTLSGQMITSDWSHEMEESWLPASGYRERLPMAVQRYDGRFKGLDRIAESELDVLVPVESVKGR